MERKKQVAGMTIFLTALTGVCVGLLLWAASRDLTISQTLHALWEKGAAAHAAGKSSVWFWWGVGADAFGRLPAFAAPLALGWCLFAKGRRGLHRRPAFSVGRLTLGLMLAGGSLAAAVLSTFFALEKFGAGRYSVLFKVLLTVGLAVFTLVWAAGSTVSEGTLLRRTVFSALLCAMSLGQLAVTQLMKAIWQRTRFDDLLAGGSLLGFTSWLTVPGGGGTSFPSGHTAAAGVLLAFAAACPLFDGCQNEKRSYIFCGYVWTFATAFGRILVGRHYLSDTVASIVIDTALVLALLHLPVCRRAMARTRERAAVLDAPNTAPKKTFRAKDD